MRYQEIYILICFLIITSGNPENIHEAFIKNLATLRNFSTLEEITVAESWYQAALEIFSARSVIDTGNPSKIYLHRLAFRSLRTCLRLDKDSASCYTQIGALWSESSNPTDQLYALPAFKKAAKLQPSAK
jgi:hypothetical protein